MICGKPCNLRAIKICLHFTIDKTRKNAKKALEIVIAMKLQKGGENENQLKTKNDECILLLFCWYYYFIVRDIH